MNGRMQWTVASLLGALLLIGCAGEPGEGEPPALDSGPATVAEEPSEPPVSRDSWREIVIRASVSEGRVLFDESHHDVGVSAPGDTVKWRLECEGCKDGFSWRVSDLQYVADLEQLHRVLIEASKSTDRDLTFDRESSGVKNYDQKMGAAREYYDLEEPGWREWADWQAEISAQSRRPRDSEDDQLWKFAVTIGLPGFDREASCEEDDLQFCWDPHKFIHPDI